MMSLPVLFGEISVDLSLNLVQIGYVWGAASLLGIAMSLTGGVIGDRIGARRILVFACLLTGVTGATRAFASDYASLTATVLVAGLFPMAAPMNVHKTCGVWFDGKGLGMANGRGLRRHGLRLPARLVDQRNLAFAAAGGLA